MAFDRVLGDLHDLPGDEAEPQGGPGRQEDAEVGLPAGFHGMTGESLGDDRVRVQQRLHDVLRFHASPEICQVGTEVGAPIADAMAG